MTLVPAHQLTCFDMLNHRYLVITKADLVDAELVDLVKLEVEEFTAGSFLENAPKVAVSAVTGAGLDELKQEIARLAKTIPAKNVSHHFRLPVDRAFSMKGFGAVVTGTLVSGALRVEQEVEIQPGGQQVRVRGIQVHGKPVTKAFAGQRTAVNLGGIDHSELRRGMVVTEPQRFAAAKLFLPSLHARSITTFQMLRFAPGSFTSRMTSSTRSILAITPSRDEESSTLVAL